MDKPKRDENVLVSILMNIILPSLVLTKGSTYLGADRALALAVALPIGYFAWDYYTRREASLMSLLGLASVLASGALGMFRATGLWFAVKEALLPSVLGLATLLSLSWRKPLINAFI
jgi:intracellular septation protein A